MIDFVMLAVQSAETATEVVTNPIWWQPLLEGATQVVLVILGLALTLLVSLAKRRMNLSQQESELVDALKVGMQHTYETYIRSLKEGLKDRKLTKQERELAMSTTLQAAKEVASGPALEFLKTKGMDWAKVKVEHLLIAIKEKAFGKKAKKEKPPIQ